MSIADICIMAILAMTFIGCQVYICNMLNHIVYDNKYFSFMNYSEKTYLTTILFILIDVMIYVIFLGFVFIVGTHTITSGIARFLAIHTVMCGIIVGIYELSKDTIGFVGDIRKMLEENNHD